MKKRIVTLLLAVGFTFCITGCSGKDMVSAMKPESKVEEEDKEEKKEKKEKKASSEEETEEFEDEKKKEKSKKAVLGGKCEGYEGFEYLYEETLMTESEENEDTGKMESQKVTIFIPQSEYTYVNRDSANSEKLGVDFSVGLNPYFQYDEDDYLLSENLAYYLEEEYDEYFTTDYKDLIISDVEEVGENAVRATVNYCEYDDWDDSYRASYLTYYVKELDNGLTVMVEVKMIPEEVTGKTDKLIGELEAFYEFEIDWDLQAANDKIDNYLANDSGDTESFSTGYLLFDLPKGWEQDKDYWDYSADAYAPDGDAEFAGCMICIKREYLGSESFDVRYLLEDKEYTVEYFTSLIGENVSNVEVEDYGSTCMGDAIEVSLTVNSGSVAGDYKFYFINDDSYLYAIEVIQTEDASEDAISVAEDILANGSLR